MYNIDIAALSETRFANERSLVEVGEGYTFCWRGLAETEPRLHEVGFAIRTSLFQKLPEAPVGISERIMTIRIPLANKRFVTLISCYAPLLIPLKMRKISSMNSWTKY